MLGRRTSPTAGTVCVCVCVCVCVRLGGGHLQQQVNRHSLSPLKLLVHQAEATSVCGLKLLVYEALSY